MVTTRAKIKKTQNNLATLIASNDNLLTEILRRLPAKSILRFKTVSKHWQSLLSHRYFTLMFDIRSICHGFFLSNFYVPFDVENPSSKPIRSLSFCHDNRDIRIVQSCNGLWLCCSDKGLECTRRYYVFNPTTKHFAVIPPVIGGLAVRSCISFMGLAYHQTDCARYKVVCVYHANSVSTNDSVLYHIQIYSSDTGNWRISPASFPLPVHMSYCREYGVYWNGAVYCTSFSYPFYFKLDTEQFHNMPLPDYYDNGVTRPYFGALYFGESRGHLHFVKTACRESPLHLNVYEMLSDHSGWFLKYQVELHDLLEAYPEMIYDSPFQISTQCYHLETIDIVKGEKEEDTFMVLNILKKIIRYNITDKSFKTIFDLHGVRGLIKNWEKVHRYIEAIGSF